jgi:hypothetical protein
MKRSREPEEAPSADAASLAAPGTNDHHHHHHHHGATMKQAIVDTDGEITPPAAKIAELDLSDGNLDGRGEIAMRCSLPPHREPVPFSSYTAYETHYRDQHTNRCAECCKNFPSAHLLGLHIEETHDSFAQARRERGDRTVSTVSQVVPHVTHASSPRYTHTSSSQSIN